MAGFQIVTPVKLGQAAINTSLATLYTVPASTRTYVKDLDIANSSNLPINITVYLVPSAGTASNANVLLSFLTVPANGLLQWAGLQVLNTGDTIQTLANGLGCTINASGGEAV